jgi:CheY-like chemotaxis protein
VDDEESVREALRAALDAIGEYSVAMAHNGATGLDMAHSVCPDILLVDLVLPDFDGLQFIRHVRSGRCTVGPGRVVLMTAFADPLPVDKLKDFGADALLLKPFQLVELTRALGSEREP